jgi:hypothetical protein
MQVASGLGRHMKDLVSDDIIHLQKVVAARIAACNNTNPISQTMYVAEILYVATLYLARLAVFRFLLLLAAERFRRRIVNLGTISTIACGIVTALVLIFRCSPPQTWALLSDRCIDQV